MELRGCLLAKHIFLSKHLSFYSIHLSHCGLGAFDICKCTKLDSYYALTKCSPQAKAWHKNIVGYCSQNCRCSLKVPVLNMSEKLPSKGQQEVIKWISLLLLLSFMVLTVQALGDIDCFQLTGGENSCLIIFNGDFKSLHFSSALSFSWPGIPWD